MRSGTHLREKGQGLAPEGTTGDNVHVRSGGREWRVGQGLSRAMAWVSPRRPAPFHQHPAAISSALPCRPPLASLALQMCAPLSPAALP